MKFLKNVLVVILSGCLFFVFLPTNVKAEDNNGVNQLSEPSSQFKDFCDEYYIKPDMFEVVDKENKDISNQFFEFAKSISESSFIPVFCANSAIGLLPFMAPLRVSIIPDASSVLKSGIIVPPNFPRMTILVLKNPLM